MDGLLGELDPARPPSLSSLDAVDSDAPAADLKSPTDSWISAQGFETPRTENDSNLGEVAEPRGNIAPTAAEPARTAVELATTARAAVDEATAASVQVELSTATIETAAAELGMDNAAQGANKAPH